jgi:hypothetical protein
MGSGNAPGFVFGGFWALLFVGTFLVAGPWAGFLAILLGCVGMLMLLFPPASALPRSWWILAALFVVLGCGAFLPAAWFGIPEWRGKLESIGVNTGSLVAIQARQAAEAFALFAITLVTGLWLAGHRPSSSQLRVWALAFTVGVAIYAIVSKLKQDPADGLFGFFPNRNHTATYLAMGTICGLGNVLQALRDRRFLAMSIALLSTAICLWAVAGWSVSRGGVVLVAIGCLLWLPMLGKRYLGRNGLRALGLIVLAGTGLFFIADSGVKERLAETVERAGDVIGPASDPAPVGGDAVSESRTHLDFRIPIALDTFELIRAFKWTGVGAGQFYQIFPQYRNHTVVANDSDSYHPESDWLWMASETGMPATLALAALVVLASWKSLADIRAGRDRALRGACLAAALLVPIHGLFDVPGHRITLALSSLFLFGLSLRPGPAGTLPTFPWRWPLRLWALPLLAAAGWLARAEWGGGPQPAIVAGQAATNKVALLLAEDEQHRKSAASSGLEYAPPPAEDPLEMALLAIDQALPMVPLQRNLHRLRGFVALHFDDKNPVAIKAFEVERALQPARVNVPFEQGRAWAELDSDQAVFLWRKSLERARWLDARFPGTSWSETKMQQRILAEIRGKPGLEAAWQKTSASEKIH